LLARRIEQEQKRAIVLRQVGERDVLPVAAIVRETKRALVDHLDEAFRPAAMLDVGRAVRIGGAEKDGILLGDETGELRRNRVGKAFCDALGVSLCRAALGLGLLRRRREDQI